MAQGLRIWDASGNIVFDTNDRAAGGTTSFSTGTADGSMTITPGAGQSVEFVFTMPGTWFPSGKASRWPTIGVSGNTITWSFNSSVPTGSRVSIPIIAVTY